MILLRRRTAQRKLFIRTISRRDRYIRVFTISQAQEAGLAFPIRSMRRAGITCTIFSLTNITSPSFKISVDPTAAREVRPVSYTHLDVYKRQVQFRIAGSVKPRRFKSSTVSRCFCRLSAASRFSRAARWQSHSDGCRSCSNHWAVSFEK